MTSLIRDAAALAAVVSFVIVCGVWSELLSVLA